MGYKSFEYDENGTKDNTKYRSGKYKAGSPFLDTQQ